uniref:Uncharacterized protein n=1 Tax=Plectus sambesii TaxID=2011161 RepID=A0A914UST8_9BILA
MTAQLHQHCDFYELDANSEHIKPENGSVPQEMNHRKFIHLKSMKLSHRSILSPSGAIEDARRNISSNTNLQEISFRNDLQRIDKYTLDVITATPGGIDLRQKLKVVNDRGVELAIRSVEIIPSKRCVQVKTSTGVFTYTPCSITADELVCLEAAVRQTTKGSLMFSMEGGCFVTDGIVPTLPAAELVSTTLNEGDHLLASLTYGLDHTSYTKTKSPVSSYANPLDVRCELLEAIQQMDVLGKQSQRAQQAFSVYSKFSNVRPWPTFIMGTSAVAVAGFGRIELRGQLLEVDMRGLYTDWLGNKYFDDEAECCIAQKPFLDDFRLHHRDYIRAYSVLTRIEEYAIVVGLCMADHRYRQSTNAMETHKAVVSKGSSQYSEDVNATFQRALAASKILVEKEKDPIFRVFMCIQLANSWLAEQKLEEAKNWSLLAILNINNISPTKASAVIIQHLSAKAHLALAQSLSHHGSSTATMKDAEAEQFELLLDVSELEYAGGAQQSKRHRYSMRALETSLHQALTAGDWSTAHETALIIAIDFGLGGVSTDKVVAEQWLHWKNTQYGGLQYRQSEIAALSSILTAMWPQNSDGEVECTDDALLSKLQDFLLNREPTTVTDAEIQLTGFVHYLHAGMYLEKTYTTSDERHHILGSSLTALSCFCRPFSTASPVDWCLLAAAAALRLVKCCKKLLVLEEIQGLDHYLEEAMTKLEDMEESRSIALLPSVLQSIHNVRQFAQKYQADNILVSTAEMMQRAYKVSGDKENESIWKRVLAVDRKNARKNDTTASFSSLLVN